MSHLAILEASKFLRHTLWLGLAADSTTRGHIGNAENNIVLSNPAQPVGANQTRSLSLWLYQVVINEHLRNAPTIRLDETRERYPPLSLNLWYLLTPSTGNDEGDQLVLGKAMQILYDQSVLMMQNGPGLGASEEFHIYLAQRTIEEMAEVWEAMQQPYRLSVAYEVRAVSIRSQREFGSERVVKRVSDFAPVGAGA
jgi:Pvc16 N-terminal domain